VNAGDLDRRVTFQARTGAEDALGQPVDSWVPVGSAWAHIKFLNGVQAIKADKSTSVAQASIRVRYRQDIAPGMRAVLGTKVFSVLAVLPDESGREFTDYVCEVVT